MQYFCLHRREAGAKGGLPAVGMKLNMLVQRLQVIINPFHVYSKLYRISISGAETGKLQIRVDQSFKLYKQNLDRVTCN